VRIRRATAVDVSILQELWRAFCDERPPPPYVELDVEQELREVADTVAEGVALLAEDSAGVVGFVLARRRGSRHGHVSDLYVRPEARRRGAAAALVRELAESLDREGVEVLDLEVAADNEEARSVYRRWGFREETLTLAAPLADLRRRLEADGGGPTFGSIHVQTDDVDAVAKAVEIYVPRLPGRSRGSIVTPPRNGYVTVYDDVCDREPAMLRRLARSIGNRTGHVVLTLGVEDGAVVRLVVLDRGGVVDEYASVPEYRGALPPGEVVALAANPVVLERYTGASRDAVRDATPTASSPAELPPPRELLAGLADALRIEGALYGWADAPEIDGARRVERS
jgi:ribosomal protein S18 acetylase RimI-like enzyme